MSNINSWNIREPVILTVLFPIFFIMSDDTTPAVDPVVAPEAPCTDESCADGSCADDSCPTPAETPVETAPETEAPAAE